MISKRSLIVHWAEQGNIPGQQLKHAVSVAGIQPRTGAWRGFLDKLFLWLGTLALAFAVLFFVAYNWDSLGRFARFGAVQGLIVVSIVAYWRLGADRLTAKASLLAASILLGVLLALYGQTYQTGADPWQLFFNWALLILPWAFIGRFASLWLVWVMLINVSIYLYFTTFGNWFWSLFSPAEQMFWAGFVFNAAVLGGWELLARRFSWLDERWAIRIVALLGGSAITMLMVFMIFGRKDANIASVPVYALSGVLLYYFYRRIIPDLFMLAAGCLSGIVVVTSFAAKVLIGDNAQSQGFLLLALIVIAMGAGSAYWLRNVQRERLS